MLCTAAPFIPWQGTRRPCKVRREMELHGEAVGNGAAMREGGLNERISLRNRYGLGTGHLWK